MQHHHHPFAWVFLLLITILPTSCGNPEQPDQGHPDRAQETESTPTPPVKNRGGELRFPLSGVRVLDPAISTSISENLVLQQIFQGLVRFDAKLRVVPDLAESWSLSDDRKTYTFHIDPNAKFHHGRSVTARDAAHSLTRMTERRLRSPARSYLKDVLDGEDAISCPSDSTLEIRIKAPDQVFIRFLAMQHTRIVPKDLCSDRTFAKNPVGSGPFKFVSWSDGTLILSTARGSDPRGPFVDRIVLEDLNRAQEKEWFLNGMIDYLVAAPDEYQELVAGNDTINTAQMPTLSLHFLGLNTARPPFDDANVRRAVAFALDGNRFVTATQGRVQRATTVLPPGMPGYNPSLDLYPFDPDRARELLREAGYGPSGREFPTIELFSGRIPEQVAVTEIIVDNLRAVGIPVILRETDDYPEFLRDLGKSECALFGWGADYPDPDNFFNNLFRTDAPYNFMHYSNPRVDELIEQGRAGVEKLDRARLYRESEEVLLKDCPLVPLFHDSAIHCVNKRVNDLDINALGIYYTRFDKVWLSPTP